MSVSKLTVHKAVTANLYPIVVTDIVVVRIEYTPENVSALLAFVILRCFLFEVELIGVYLVMSTVVVYLHHNGLSAVGTNVAFLYP